jgi:dTDP-4-dehydrorhamnose reductase
VRLIHPSSDCVFNGIENRTEDIKSDRDTPPYSECHLPNENGTYGMSKYLGETNLAGNLTIRSSIIGHEVNNCKNLLDWFLQQNNRVDGYTQVFWNGITTLTWAKIALRIIQKSLYMNRKIIQVASPQIVSKYELLSLFAEVYDKKILIDPIEEPKTNKTLVVSANIEEIINTLKPLKEQLIELKNFYAVQH